MGINFFGVWSQLQRLDQHLFAVGYVAQQLYSRFYPDKIAQAKAVFIAGCLHDIGKIDPSFQDWVVKDKSKSYIPEDGQHIDGIKKFSFENHPRHNEISVLLYQLLDDVSLKALSQRKNLVKHAIYWHHAKPFRPNGGFETLGDIYKKINTISKGEAWSLVVLKSIEVLNKVCGIDKNYNESRESFLSNCYLQNPDIDRVDDIESMTLPKYKMYEPKKQLSDFSGDVSINATNNEIRACLITADRWVSSMSSHELASAIKHKTLTEFIEEKLESNQIITESNLVSNIAECINSFPDNERTKKQADIANQLAGNIKDIGVLAGAAGCGKTKIALEWAQLRNAQQIIWICPRVQICQGLFAELRNSDEPYLPNTTVELYTGEFKCTDTDENITTEKDYFTGDVVITTIDQIISSVISHTKADRLLNYLSAHVVFDEFHEYINMPAFNLLFAELIASKKDMENGDNTLLVSATPHYYYLKNILDLDKNHDVFEMPSFNQSHYQFELLSYDENIHDDSNPLYKPQKATTFVISNTATTAQKSFIKNQHNENAILLHSKYKKSDKQELFNDVFETFKDDGTGRFDLLRSGPIVQASLNISCEYMVSEITHAENCLQRLGRLDRFGLNSTGVNQYTLVIPETLHVGKGSLAHFLSSTNSLASTKAWYEFLREETNDGEKILTLTNVYLIYKKFYEDPTAIKFIERDLLASMEKSVNLIVAKISEPQTIIKPKKENKQRAKISKNSLRGDNRFVQMAVCDVNDPNEAIFLEEYAYNFPVNESDEIDGLTASCGEIEGYGDSSNSLLSHMMKKHHNIMGEKKAFKDFILLNDAKDPEFPVYLSYTPNDLLTVGGERARHSAAIYYGVCEKQPIGAISVKQLINQED